MRAKFAKTIARQRVSMPPPQPQEDGEAEAYAEWRENTHPMDMLTQAELDAVIGMLPGIANRDEAAIKRAGLIYNLAEAREWQKTCNEMAGEMALSRAA